MQGTELACADPGPLFFGVVPGQTAAPTPLLARPLPLLTTAYTAYTRYDQVEIKELTRARDDLERLKYEIVEERRKEIAPMMEAVTHEIKSVKDQIWTEKDRLEVSV